MKWIDRTSYSKDDKERTQKVWEIGIAHALHISLVRGPMFYPDEWVINCHQLSIENRSIGYIDEMTVQKAKNRAIAEVKAQIESLLADIKKIKKEQE